MEITMSLENLKRQFAKIGATLEVKVVPAIGRQLRWQARPGQVDYLFDVTQAKHGEQFALTVRNDAVDKLEFLVIDLQPQQRHLLLLLKQLEAETARRKDKFLCGHDERHWFIAPVPGADSLIRVEQAFEALKPAAALQSQQRRGVRSKDWNKRRNAGFVRQGEWFFVPQPAFQPDNPLAIWHNEPIRRSGSKPHIVEQLYRIGGATVYVSSKYPRGLTEGQYHRLLQHDRVAQKLTWQVMRRNPQVFAKGKIRHPDHKTINLPFWHRVVMNVEGQVDNVVFLD
jgi:hypothetical protein